MEHNKKMIEIYESLLAVPREAGERHGIAQELKRRRAAEGYRYEKIRKDAIS